MRSNGPRQRAGGGQWSCERVGATPLLVGDLNATDEELRPLAAALRLELLHDLSRALHGFASNAMSPSREHVLSGALFRTPDGCFATFTLVNATGGQVVWADRVEVAQQAGVLLSQRTRRISRGVVIALHAAAARVGCRGADTAAMRAWLALWARPQSEGTNAAALAALHSISREHSAKPAAMAALAYAKWRAARYGWNNVERAATLRSALSIANAAVERAPGDPDAQFVLGMAQFPYGDGALAAACLRAAITADPSHAPAHGNLGFLLLRQGDFAAARTACELALTVSPQEPLSFIWHACLSLVHARMGDPIAACSAAALARAAHPNHRFGWLASAIAAGIAGSHDEAQAAFERMESIGPTDGFGPELWPWCKPLIEQARSIAAPRVLHPVHAAPRIRLVTLGGFRIEIQGRAVHWNRKAPRRPLDILKLLIVHRGQPVAVTTLLDTLWPGEAGPRVRRRLDTAIYRLRRILGDAVIRSGSGFVSLAPEQVQVDAFEFQRRPDPMLYAGSFLPDDLHVAWTVPMRESLRDALQAAVAQGAERLMLHGRYAEALSACEHGTTHHPTSETLYRLAMRICALAGWRSEGLRFYERCRDCLNRELGVRPSRATIEQHLRLLRAD